MARLGGQQIDVDTQLLACGSEFVISGDLKQDASIRGNGQPAISRHFLFQLPGTPPCLAQGNQIVLGSIS